MVKQRQSTAAVELTQEHEELAQRIYRRLKVKLNEELARARD